jgi:spore coat protein U domain-containing protein, fimbrial subunit CupE1/2/3/6
MLRFSEIRIVIGFFFLLAAHSLQAATSAAPISVSATVIAACTLGTSTLAFGTFTPGGSALNANGSLIITCTNGDHYTIALNAGLGSGATIPVRVLTKLAAPTGTLRYTIYTTTARTTVWGNGISGSTVTGTGTGVAQTLTVPGTIFAGQGGTATPGNYTDSVMITVTF